jgi:hypothetical protein
VSQATEPRVILAGMGPRPGTAFQGRWLRIERCPRDHRGRGRTPLFMADGVALLHERAPSAS